MSVYRRLLPVISLLLQPNPPTAAIAVTLLWQFAEGSHTHTHTHTHPFNGPLSGTTQVSQHQNGKTSLDLTGATDSEWQWNQLDHMQVCTALQTDNQASTQHCSVFYRPDALPAAQPTVSKHWRELTLLRNISAFCRGVRDRNSESTVVGNHSSVA